MTSDQTTTSILSGRGNPDKRVLLEEENLNRTIVTIPATDWALFVAWAARPAEAIPALQELGWLTPTWQR